MAVRIFKAGYLSSERERIQMNKLVGYLLSTFSLRENEKCDLIIEPKIPELLDGREIPRHPDALILKDNVFVLVEMKGFKGRITADCSSEGVWRNENGKSFQPPNGQNPFEQSAFYRDVLVNFLQERFVDLDCAENWAKISHEKTLEWIREHVFSLVVTDEASRPSIIGFMYGPPSFFDVVPLDKLPQKLAFLRANTQIFKPSELARFIESIGAEPAGDEWYLGKLTEQSSFVGLIPKITSWMESEKYENLSKALTYTKELELKQHVPHILNCWHNRKYPNLRKECLFLLIEWQYGQIGSVLDEALNDENPEIFRLSLEYLSKHGYIETLPTLKHLLKAGSIELQNLALKAIAATPGKSGSTSSVILNFAKDNLFSRPFNEFQFLDQRNDNHDQTMHGVRDERLITLNHKRASYVRLFCTVIDSLGSLDCKASVPWIMEIVDEPTSIGFETNDYNQLNSLSSSYYRIFESACKSLGKLGIGDKNVTLLLIKKLKVSPMEYQQCIIHALGDLRDLEAESALMPFVYDSNNTLFQDAMVALSRMKSNKAFGPLVRVFLSDIHGQLGHWVEEALRDINPPALEKILLDQIGSKRNNNETKNYLLSLLVPIASIRSANILFPLLTDTELWNNASWVLWKLAENKPVHDRAMTLLRSENPLERASGISILADYFKKKLNALEEFKTDSSVEVRQAVLGIFYECKLESKVKQFAEDPNKHIRDSVFLFFASEATLISNCLMASDFEDIAKCEALITNELIVLQLPQKILFIQRKNVKKSQITTNGTGRFGVHIEIAEPSSTLRHMLLVPLDRYRGLPETLSSERMAQWLLSVINRSDESVEYPKTTFMDKLWKKIPEEFFARNAWE